MRKILLLLLVTLLTLSVVAQGDGSGNDNGSLSDQGNGMGGEMLGGSAETTELASQEVDSLPEEPLAWTVLDLAGVGNETVIRTSAPVFLYAHEGSHTIMIAGEETTVEESEARFVDQGDELGLADTEGLWFIMLAGSDSEPPAQLENAELVTKSQALAPIPQSPVQLSFVLVELPMDSATAVHAHPGPEFIYVTQGEIEYQTGTSDTEVLSVGDARALPTGVSVQKRNPMGEPATFVSWFIVDADKPFAVEASFD